MSDFAECFPPSAYIIGAQKSGTTSLANYLEGHPEICVAKPKEPDYFSGQWHRGEAWYRGVFSPNSKTRVLVDASTSYSMAPIDGLPASSGFSHVPERIFARCPNAKFIYILRDPVARAYSGYWHAVRGRFESRPLAEAISTHSDYIRGSRYPEQIQAYRDYFPMENFLFIDFHAFIKDPASAIDSIERHIGVGHHPIDIDQKKSNDSFLFNRTGSLLVNAAGGLRNFEKMIAVTKRVIPDSLTTLLKKKLINPIPPMDEQSWNHIYSLLSETYPKTFSTTGIQFKPHFPGGRAK